MCQKKGIGNVNIDRDSHQVIVHEGRVRRQELMTSLMSQVILAK